ncbi:MAG: hypothetical protein ACE5HT_16915 [Gemmatimonadales bacterium]
MSMTLGRSILFLAGLSLAPGLTSKVRGLVLGCLWSLIAFPVVAQRPESRFLGCYRVDVGPWQIDGRVVPDPPGPLPEQIRLTSISLAEEEAIQPRFEMRAAPGMLANEFDEAIWWPKESGTQLILRWANAFYGIVAELTLNGELEDGRERLSGEARAWGDELNPKWPRSVMTLTPVDCH